MMPIQHNGNIIRIIGRYDGSHLRRLLGRIHHAVEHLGYPEIVLDFSKCENPFESGMLPIIPIVREYIVRKNVDFELKLPFDTRARALFHNCGWDFWIDPKRFGDRANQRDRHLPVLQFIDSSNQHTAVDRLIDQLSRNAQLTKDQLQAIEWSTN